jgi:hypothetical protein
MEKLVGIPRGKACAALVMQMKYGAKASDIKCRQKTDLRLFLKSSDGSVIHVKTKSDERLAKLGFTTLHRTTHFKQSVSTKSSE